jgi:predicted phosphatase
MIVVRNDKTVWVDCDDTLINHFIGIPFDEKEHVRLNNGEIQAWKITRNEPNIRALKHHKQLGLTVFVWSMAGYKHAENVVKALELENFVDFVVSKPDCYIDDKDASVWLNGKRRFYE